MAGQTSASFNVGAEGSSLSLSQLYDHCQKNIALADKDINRYLVDVYNDENSDTGINAGFAILKVNRDDDPQELLDDYLADEGLNVDTDLDEYAGV